MHVVLYLDESGPFDVPRDPVVVAGFVATSRSFSWLSAQWGLERLAPGAPWPLHMIQLRCPAFHVVTRYRTPHTTRAIDEAGTILSALPDFRGLLADKTNVQATRSLDAHFKVRARDLHSHVEQTIVLPLFERLQAEAPTIAANVDGFAIVASEPVRGRGRARTPDHDRYVELLTSAVERAAELCRFRHADAQVELHVTPLAKRLRRTVGERGKVLSTEKLQSVLAGITVAGVKIVAGQIPLYKGSVLPGYVLADYIAHRSKPCFCRGRRASLSAMEVQFVRDVGLSAWTAVDGVRYSHLAASEPIRGWIKSRRSDSTTPEPSGVAAWSLQQAKPWVAVAAV